MITKTYFQAVYALTHAKRTLEDARARHRHLPIWKRAAARFSKIHPLHEVTCDLKTKEASFKSAKDEFSSWLATAIQQIKIELLDRFPTKRAYIEGLNFEIDQQFEEGRLISVCINLVPSDQSRNILQRTSIGVRTAFPGQLSRVVRNQLSTTTELVRVFKQTVENHSIADPSIIFRVSAAVSEDIFTLLIADHVDYAVA